MSRRFRLPVWLHKPLNRTGPSSADPPRRRGELLWDLCLPTLVLWTALISFVRYHDFSLMTSELTICLGVTFAMGSVLGLIASIGNNPVLRSLVVTAVLTAFVDVQFDLADTGIRLRHIVATTLVLSLLLRRHITKILCVSFSAMLAITIVVPPQTLGRNPSRYQGGSSDVPLLIHIVLDGHVGMEGIPTEVPGATDLKRRIVDSYVEKGFRVFGRAYSHFPDTKNSLGNMFNFTEESTDLHYFSSADSPTLLQNAYFQRLQEWGYGLRVYQPGYIDYCRSEGIEVSSCYTYAHAGLSAVEGSELGAGCKSVLLMRSLARRSTIFLFFGRKLPQVWQRGIELGRKLCGGGLPEWFWWRRTSVAPFSSLKILAKLRTDLTWLTEGTAVFAHVIVPHYPFVVDADCELLPVAEWLHRREFVKGAVANNLESRHRRYLAYLKQVECVHKQVGEILEVLQERGVYQRSWILIHGDHGSGLSISDPEIKSQDLLTPRDYVDLFSTFFAVRRPGFEAGYDTANRALEDLLKAMVDAGGGMSEVESDPHPYVFLRGESGAPMSRRVFSWQEEMGEE